jgi:anti-sigma regulatory factor (Ser/Thr protein kinase)
MRGFTTPVVAPVAELSIRADADEFRRASAWLEQACRERKVPADRIARLDACVNEVLANIITHGGARALSLPIGLHLEVRHDHDGSTATVTVSDGGAAFDPVAFSLPPRPATLADAEPGGLGLVMIRSYADRLSYRHSEQRNRFGMGVLWTE